MKEFTNFIFIQKQLPVHFPSVSSHFSLMVTEKQKYRILSSTVRTFFIVNDAEILPAHYIYKVVSTNLIHKQSIQATL